MIRPWWPYASLISGSAITAGACFGLAALGGMPQLPVSTAYSTAALVFGVVAIVAGVLVALAVVGAFGQRRPKDNPVRSRKAARPDGHSAGRVQDSSVPRARRCGGNEAAGPRGTNGGGPAAHNIDATEVLPAIGEASTAVFTLPLWAGRADSPRGSGRPTIKLRAVEGRARPPARTAGGFDEGWEPPAHKPARVPARGGAARITVAAPASGNPGAATTLTLPSAADPQPAGVPQRAYHRSAARGDAAHVVTRLAGVGRPTTWTAGSGCVAAGLDENTTN